jgi:hypothetical protein
MNCSAGWSIIIIIAVVCELNRERVRAEESEKVLCHIFAFLSRIGTNFFRRPHSHRCSHTEAWRRWDSYTHNEIIELFMTYIRKMKFFPSSIIVSGGNNNNNNNSPQRKRNPLTIKHTFLYQEFSIEMARI